MSDSDSEDMPSAIYIKGLYFDTRKMMRAVEATDEDDGRIFHLIRLLVPKFDAELIAVGTALESNVQEAATVILLAKDAVDTDLEALKTRELKVPTYPPSMMSLLSGPEYFQLNNWY